MSIKNLFVNARTKILEFKRKHNFLVEKVKSVEEEIPTTQQITTIANSAIQADKDILSKITLEYDEDNNKTTFIFPKGILVIKFYCYFSDELHGAMFVDYDNSRILNTEGISVYEFSLSYTTDHFALTVDGDYQDSFITELFYDLMYINYINDDGGDYYNWYNILNPQPVGTKLYKHKIKYATSYNSSPSGAGNIFIISTDKDPYTDLPLPDKKTIVSIFFDWYYHIFSGAYNDGHNYYQFLFYYPGAQTPTITFEKAYKSNATDFDTVTEL